MDNPLVSVITLTYNHQKYISQCIESVVAQSYSNWEMIIIDDCSKDDTQSIICKYLKDKRIKYIRHDMNWGFDKLPSSYNQALLLCKGQYIAILEGDDFWPPWKLKIQISNMLSNPDCVLSHGIVCEYINGKKFILSPKLKISELENNPIGSALKIFLKGHNFIGSSTVMIKKETLETIGGFKPDFSFPLVDYPTWMELSLRGKFIFIPIILGYWRLHKDSISSVYSDLIINTKIDYIEKFIKCKKGQILKLFYFNKNLLDAANSISYLEMVSRYLIINEKKKARAIIKLILSKKYLRYLGYTQIIKLFILIFSAYLINIYKIRNDIINRKNK